MFLRVHNIYELLESEATHTHTAVQICTVYAAEVGSYGYETFKKTLKILESGHKKVEREA